MRNSTVLKSDILSFYKVTERIYIQNIDIIVRYTISNNCLMLAALRTRNKIDTRFFNANIQYFRDKLLDVCHDCDDYNGRYLEDVYFSVLSTQKRGKFFCYPVYKGSSGSDRLLMRKMSLNYWFLI